MIVIGRSDIVTAFDAKTIGSKVVEHRQFLEHLHAAIEVHDPAGDRQPGQHFIPMSALVIPLVSSGVGPASPNPDHYVLRFHREKVSAYLRRQFAAPVDSVACVVYTVEAFNKDPDCNPAEVKRISDEGATHVIVAVLASAGPKVSPLTPFRLVHNLAGSKLEAEKYTADEIRAKAKESLAYHNSWSTVAD
jgi:hypothetical protein